MPEEHKRRGTQNFYRGAGLVDGVGEVRDRPLFLSGVLPFLGLADNFFLRVMHLKQFFSLHFVMETIFLQPFLENVTGFFIDLI